MTPFAPAVLADAAAHWFGLERESPYMLLVADVAAKYRLINVSKDVEEDRPLHKQGSIILSRHRIILDDD